MALSVPLLQLLLLLVLFHAVALFSIPLCTHTNAHTNDKTSTEQLQPHHSFQLHLADDWLLQDEYDSVRGVTQSHSSASATDSTPPYTRSHSHSHSHSRSSSAVTATLKWKEADTRTATSQTDGRVSNHRRGDRITAAAAAATVTSSSSNSSHTHTHTHTHTHSFSSNHSPIHHSHSHTHTHRPLLHYTLLAEWSDHDEAAVSIRADGSSLRSRNMKRDRSWSRKKHEPTSNTSSSHTHSSRTISQNQDDSVATTRLESSHHHHQHHHHRRILCSDASLTSCTAADLPIHTPITLQLIINHISQTCDCQCQCECKCEEECKKKTRQQHNGDIIANCNHHPLSSILSSPTTIILQPRDSTHDDVGSKAVRDVNGNTHHDSTSPHHVLTQAQSDATAGIFPRHAAHATPILTTKSLTVTGAAASTDATSTPTSSHRHHPHVDNGVQVMEMRARHRKPLHYQPPHPNAHAQEDGLFAALCRFFDETNGEQWSRNDGWRQSCIDGETVAVCEWHGIQCDESGQHVVSLDLRDNQLDSHQQAGGSMVMKPFSNSLFERLTSLESLDFSQNPDLLFPTPFDLSTLTQFKRLHLRLLSPDGVDQRPGSAPEPTWDPANANDSRSSIIHLLPPASMLELDMSSSFVQVDLHHSHMPALTSLTAGWLPFEMDALPALPMIRTLRVQFTGLTTRDNNSSTSSTTRHASSGVGQHLAESVCDECILRILANLTHTNPHLTSLFLFDAHIGMVDTGSALSAFPIIHSASLEQLALSGSWLPTLIPDEWLSGLPLLRGLTIQQSDAARQRLSMNARSFELAPSTSFTAINILDVNMYGESTPLARFHSLSTLIITNCGWRTTLPSNLSSCWPSIRHINLHSNALVGTLPSFADLAELRVLDLSRNGWQSELPTNFLAGCKMLFTLDLSNNRFGPSLPSLASVSNLQSLQLHHNLFHATIPHSWSFPIMSTLDLSHNQIHGSLPEDWWRRVVPSLTQSLSLAYNNLSGPIPDPDPAQPQVLWSGTMFFSS